jgi:hypothetical protein
MQRIELITVLRLLVRLAQTSDYGLATFVWSTLPVSHGNVGSNFTNAYISLISLVELTNVCYSIEAVSTAAHMY